MAAGIAPATLIKRRVATSSRVQVESYFVALMMLSLTSFSSDQFDKRSKSPNLTKPRSFLDCLGLALIEKAFSGLLKIIAPKIG